MNNVANSQTLASPGDGGHPMAQYLGQEFVGVSHDGKVTMTIPFQEKFIGNTLNQSMHLGPITALLDSAAGLSVMQANGSFSPFVTLDLRIDQLNPAVAGCDITVECYPYLRKGDLFYVKGIAWQKNKDQAVLAFYSVFMAAHATFNLDGSQSQAPPMETNKALNIESPTIIDKVDFITEPHAVHEVVPYSKDLKMEVGKNQQGERLVKLPFEDRHMGNPVTKALQGGIFLGFLECAGSAYLLDIYPQLKQSVSASFFIEYLKASKPQDTFAKISASKIGRRVVNIDLTAFQEGRGIIAKASGRYLVLTE